MNTRPLLKGCLASGVVRGRRSLNLGCSETENKDAIGMTRLGMGGQPYCPRALGEPTLGTCLNSATLADMSDAEAKGAA